MREGLLQPSRTDGNTRLYSEEDLEQLETILTLTRDLGVNLAGVEIILNMRRKMEGMQAEVNEFMRARQTRARPRHRRLGAAPQHRSGEIVTDRPGAIHAAGDDRVHRRDPREGRTTETHEKLNAIRSL